MIIRSGQKEFLMKEKQDFKKSLGWTDWPRLTRCPWWIGGKGELYSFREKIARYKGYMIDWAPEVKLEWAAILNRAPEGTKERLGLYGWYWLEIILTKKD